MSQVDIDQLPLTFGKYKGKTPDEVGDIDPSYVVWMYENVKPTPCTKELAESCEWDVREQQAEGLDYRDLMYPWKDD
jgi:uncharacterized protein (DUF3820 family)